MPRTHVATEIPLILAVIRVVFMAYGLYGGWLMADGLWLMGYGLWDMAYGG